MFPSGVINDSIVYVGCGIFSVVPQDLVHESLKCGRGPMQPEWHARELKQALGGGKGCLFPGEWGQGNLLVPLRQVKFGEDLCLP